MTTAIPSFAPTGGAGLSATGVSSRIILPVAGTPTIAIVTNLGDYPVFVALGSALVVAIGTSQAIMPGESIALTIGANTYLAAITNGNGCGVNIAVGN